MEFLYLLRRKNPYRPEESWFYKEGQRCWTNKVEEATFLRLERAEAVALQVLEEINVACDMLGPYR